MRALLLVLGVALAGFGAWWLLRAESPRDVDLEGAEVVRPAGPAREPEPVAVQVPRVGVRGGPKAPGMVPDPDAGPWETFILHLKGKPDEPLTGAVLLEAIGERLYVRARTQAELDALRAHVFEGFTSSTSLTLGAAVVALEAAGWKAGVRDPLLVVRPVSSDELARARGAAGER